MKAILVSVDFADLLKITLPYNRHHFDEVMVVTSSKDEESLEVALDNDASVYVTDSFYEGGAAFNKWKALEEGLDRLGRDGWLCIMDVDVLWPKELPARLPTYHFTPGNLYTPYRRMFVDITLPIPQEKDWGKYPLHPQQREFAGYTQMFHASDPVLGKGPWHETNWRHAGGADSFFQARWKEKNKIRPPFEVLHLGLSGVNWAGRASTRVDGSTPEEARNRQEQVRRFVRGRTQGPTRFDGEKLL